LLGLASKVFENGASGKPSTREQRLEIENARHGGVGSQQSCTTCRATFSARKFLRIKPPLLVARENYLPPTNLPTNGVAVAAYVVRQTSRTRIISPP